MLLKNARILNDDFLFEYADIQIKDEKIVRINKNIADDEILDLTGCTVIPGFIDTHIHGAYHVEFTDEYNDFSNALMYEAKNGVTTIAATTDCKSQEQLIKNIKKIVSNCKNRNCGAKIGGIHLEGPFVSPECSGALDPAFIQKPNLENLIELIYAGEHLVKIITIAPELENAKEIIEYCVDKNIKISLGHSNATMLETREAIDWGASQSTHTFNGMRSFNHREPGILGEVLLNDNVKCEVISDFIHLNSQTVKMIYKLKGKDNINIISDTINLAGIDDGIYIIDGIKNYVNDGVIRLENGTINGSTKPLYYAFNNLLSIDIPMENICVMMSKNPALTLNIYHETGSIKEGKYADIVVLDDNLNIKYTLINGKIEYQGE